MLTNAYNTVIQTSSRDGLQLLPAPYQPPWDLSWQQLFGITIAAGLLSLGAPFWFNTLKSLASLRSSLADAIDDSPKQQ
jgi:hypothetical protein